jgi:predicted flap endonuclease-1-like 5' DNA nuclease
MLQLIEANGLLVVLALLVGLLTAWFVFVASRRTRIRRPDDAEAGPARRNQALIDTPPVAARDEAPAADPASDLARLKGVGPKLIAQLNALGVTSIAQIARWNAADIARIDSQLGRFAGRITRDEWVTQAQLLESGDETAFAERFGQL